MRFNDVIIFCRILFVLLILGCAAQPQSSYLIDSCRRLEVGHQLFAGREGAYWGENMLSTSDQVQGRKKKIGAVSEGTKVRVSGIFKDSDGSYGAFLRVEVTIIDGPYSGVKVDVPACVPYHPSVKWVESCSLNANELRFNEKLTSDCSN